MELPKNMVHHWFQEVSWRVRFCRENNNGGCDSGCLISSPLKQLHRPARGRRFYKTWHTSKKKAFTKYQKRWEEDSKEGSPMNAEASDLFQWSFAADIE